MKYANSPKIQRLAALRSKHSFSSASAARHTVLLALLTAGFALPVKADSLSVPAADAVFELGAYTIYGEPTQLTDLIETRTTAATLMLLEKKTVADALSLTPGVTLTRFGGRNETAVYVRGFARNQTPLFVDGIPVYVPYDGIIDLGRFTTYDIAAIDVAKGYSSALFGPNTMGGAINLVTRRPTEPFEGRISAGVFSGDGAEASVNAGARRDRFYVQIGASQITRNDYAVSDAFVPVPAEDGGDRNNSYYNDWKVSAKIGYTPNATDEYALGFIHQEGDKGNPPQTTAPKYWRWPQWDKETFYFVSTTKLGDASYVKPRLYHDSYDNSLSIFDDATYTTQAKSSSGTSLYNEYTYGGSLEFGTESLARQTVKGIVHYKFDHHAERPDLQRKPATRYVDEDEGYSYAIEDTIHLAPRWDAQASASYDTRETRRAVDTTTGAPFALTDFSSFNPQAGLFFRPNERHLLRVTVARKSRFPSMKERYSYRMGNGQPNPDLEAESALHYELGYTGQPLTGLAVRAAVFFSRIDDTIQQVYLSPTSTVSQFQNIGTSEKSGAELGADYVINPKLSLGGGIGYLHQKTLTTLAKNTEPVKATDTPERSGFLHAEFKPLPWLSLVPSAEFSSWRYSYSDGKGTTRTVPGFGLLNFKASFRLPHEIVLSIGVENLGDKNYLLQEGYPEAGRSWFANVRYAF